MASPLELKVAIPALAVGLGDQMVPRVVAAVNDGMKAGNLTRDEGRRIVTAVADFVDPPEGQPPDETPDE
jgi:hypothetical protein